MLCSRGIKIQCKLFAFFQLLSIAFQFWTDLLKPTPSHFLADAQRDLARLAISHQKQLAYLLSLLLLCYCLSVVISSYLDSRELMQLLSDWLLWESFDLSMMGPVFISPLFIYPYLCLCFIAYQLFCLLASQGPGYPLLTCDLKSVEHDAHGCRAPPSLTLCL
ncbi:hypothetical protein Shew_0365 [Shewanella loihica PV-4]|uniref:Uncharacterized protein n=1 Tax=Shewanella loihica (strain ATCC BAA-1088 / PV-4) TaxID=323850 RepID=A3Q9T9_SHELP|nr:hypothetical protein Shew_0365 [Shewanella loihica PV-4]